MIARYDKNIAIVFTCIYKQIDSVIKEMTGRLKVGLENDFKKRRFFCFIEQSKNLQKSKFYVFVFFVQFYNPIKAKTIFKNPQNFQKSRFFQPFLKMQR